MPESAHLSHLGPNLSQLNAASLLVGWAWSRTGSCGPVLPSGPVSSQVLPEYAIVFKERAIINSGDHMGQHPPGLITRSVPARAGKGGDQRDFIHRLIPMQCVSAFSGGNCRKGGERGCRTFSSHSWRSGRAGVTPFPG